MPDPAPLILTLALDERSFRFFDSARRQHFPPERNHIPAHVTLFHALPGAEVATVLVTLEALCREVPRFPVAVTGLRSLGRGVAYTLHSPDLARLRGVLAARWDSWLGPQDRQKHSPHVTVQNKVDPATARDTLERLRAAFAPFDATGEGLVLWHYRGGPWEEVRSLRFEAAEPEPPP